MTPRLDRRCRSCGDRTMRGSSKCAACSHADEQRGHLGDRLPASCWCRDTTVWITRRFLNSGLTRSCGAQGCGPEVLAA